MSVPRLTYTIREAATIAALSAFTGNTKRYPITRKTLEQLQLAIASEGYTWKIK